MSHREADLLSQFRSLIMRHFPPDVVSVLHVRGDNSNGSGRELFSDPAKFRYTSLGFAPGPDIEIMPRDRSAWSEFGDASFDVVIADGPFSHADYPWMVMREVARVLKTNGLACISAFDDGLRQREDRPCFGQNELRAYASWAGLHVLEYRLASRGAETGDETPGRNGAFAILYKDKAVTQAVRTFSEGARRSSAAMLNTNSPLRLIKGDTYYRFPRADAVNFIKKNGFPAVRVLELGCAGGATGKLMKETLTVNHYVGVEISEEAAGEARAHLDRVIVSDIEAEDLAAHGIERGSFDLVLALDVLEHLYDPWDMLARLADYLRPGGNLVASIPNVRNVSVLQGLLQGRWSYADAGILDATHLRFFTRESILSLFQGAGLPVNHLDVLLNPPLDTVTIKDHDNSLRLGSAVLSGLSRAEMIDLFAYQYIVGAQKLPVAETEKSKTEPRSAHSGESAHAVEKSDAKMRVLFIVHNFPPHNFAGVENYAFNVARELTALNVDVAVLYPLPSSDQPLHTITKGSYRGLTTYTVAVEKADITTGVTQAGIETAFRTLLSDQHFDIIHVHHTHAFLPLSLVTIAKQMRIPVVLTLHDFWLICMQTHLYQQETNTVCSGPDSLHKCSSCLFRDDGGASTPQQRDACLNFLAARQKVVANMLDTADLVTAPSKFIAETFARYGCGLNKIIVSPLGISPFKPVKRRAGKTLTFGYIGTIIDVKDIFGLVRTFSKTRGNARLVIYGGGPASCIQQLADSLRDHRIEYRGAYTPEQLPEILAVMDVVIVPSLIESYCLTVREALAAGLPVIASHTGGIPEIVTHGENGLLFPPGDHAALQKAIQSCIDEPALVKKLHRFTPIRVVSEDAAEWRERYMRIAVPSSDAVAAPAEQELHSPSNALPAGDRENSKRRGKNMVSIVILTCNQISYTKECVESIQKHTPEHHELIFIDNGSTDGTVTWLKKQVSENSHYHLIENKTNLGFAKGCNQGMERAQGEYILLLNNDVVVTKGWLAGLLECLNRDPQTGIVGPMTNNISGPQQVPAVDYHKIEELARYAERFRADHRYRRIPYGRIVGFCMLFRHSLFDLIGGLDESFGIGNFEDDDFCHRAALEGYQNVIAGDVFIHHYGSRSFIGNKVDLKKLYSRNVNVFFKKWSALDINTDLGKKAIALKALQKSGESYEAGNLQSAVDILLEGIKYAPADSRLYYSLADYLLDSKRYQDAWDALSELPDRATARAAVLRGHCLEGLGRLEAAWSESQSALAYSPEHAPALNLQGILSFDRGDKAKAKSLFAEAIRLDPGFGEAYTNLGVILWSEREIDDGVAHLEKGFQLNPCRNDLASRYSAAADQIGRHARAERLVQEARAFYPRNRMLAFLHIDLLLKQEKYARAMSETERCLILFGTDEQLLSAATAIREKVGPRAATGKKAHPSLSVCMIVRNEERMLAKCLSSLSSVADELIVVDTGSSDRTVQIAEVFGAKVFKKEWTRDFSAARNYALAQATGDWVLVMDADEVLSPLDHEKLRIVMRGPRKCAYAFITRNYTDRTNVEGWTANINQYGAEEAGTGWIPSVKVRLFPRHGDIRFVNPVHELVEPSLKKLGIPVKPCDIPIHHYGKLGSGEEARRKGEEYYLIGKKKLEEAGGDFNALKELAIQAGEIDHYEEALELWRRALAIEPDHASAFFNMGYCYLKLNRNEEGSAASQRALELDPTLKEAVLNFATCEMRMGNGAKAAAALEQLLADHPDHPSALSLLGVVYIVIGKLDEGMRCMDTIRRMNGDCAELMLRHAKKFVELNDEEGALAILRAAVAWGYVNQEILTHLHALERTGRQPSVCR